MKDKEQIINRCLIQGTLSFRAQLENLFQNGSKNAVDVILLQNKWFENEKLDVSMCPAEIQIIEKKPGSWDQADIMENFWKVESFKALLWSLRLYQTMPPYYDVGEVNGIYKMIQVPNCTKKFNETCSSRSELEIQSELVVYRYLDWRCRTELMKIQGLCTFPEESADNGVLSEIQQLPNSSTKLEIGEKDLQISGIPFSEYEDKGTVMSTCYERHLALEWILNGNVWWETITDN